MPRREDKSEMIVRGLLKQPDNRRCINCNSLGPQYVCATFWTFVCTNCSGVHREFSHRVKSVSMAKFNDDEINALQAGGNERAKKIYFRSWDSRSSYPDSNNLQKLREFVNSVYMERKYSGERKLPMREKSDSRESFTDWPCRWGRRDDYLGRSAVERGICSRDDLYDHSLFDKSSSAKGGRGLNLRDFLEERNPNNNEKPATSSTSQCQWNRQIEIVDDRFREDGRVKRYQRNPVGENASRIRSPESLRNSASLPVNAILGDQIPKLRVTAENETETETDDDDEKERIEKGDDAAGNNLIDFCDVQQDTMDETSTAQSAAATNSVESLLFQLTASPSPPMMNETSNTAEALSDIDTLMQDIHTSQLPSNYNTLQTASSVESSLNEQGSNRSAAAEDLRRTKSVPVVQPLQPRKEIPEDLFTSGYPSFNPPVGGWHMHMPQGYNMQLHHPAMPIAGCPISPKPRNPFDWDDDGFQVQAPAYPSMPQVQGDIPNMQASAALQFHQSPYALAHSQSHMSAYGLNMPQVPGAYTVQQLYNPLLTSQEGNAYVGRSEDVFASLNPIQRKTEANSFPYYAAPTSPLPRTGNPFE